MGWLWASPKLEPPTPTSPPPPEPAPLDPSHPPPPSNPDLADFLTALRPPPPTPPTSPLPITPLTIHPTTLSCRAAFDTAFYCASLGGQFTSLYRHGSLRACSEQWSDFWFCVRTNRGMYSDEERRARVVARAVGRERERYYGGGGSSEDVWEQRGRVVRGAFGGDYWGAVAEGEGRGGGGG